MFSDTHSKFLISPVDKVIIVCFRRFVNLNISSEVDKRADNLKACHSEQLEESLFRIPGNFNSSTRFFGKASE